MSERGTVLYDAPGPRTRRVTLVASVVAAIALLAAAYWFVYRPLADHGEFTMEKWGPLVDPGNEATRIVWRRLAEGLRATLLAAAFAIVSSLLFGTLLAVLRVQLTHLRRRRFSGFARPMGLAIRVLSAALTGVARLFVEVFRGAPVVITIFFVWRVLPEFGLQPPDVSLPGLPMPSEMWSLVIGLTLYNGVVIGEILRSGMQGLPRGQSEAAQAIGLTTMQTTTRILLPQAYRIMLPALISQLVVVLKDTALGFIITYQELMRTARFLADNLDNPMQMFAVAGAIFVLLNYALSRLAGYVERRIARGRRTAAPPVAGVPTESLDALLVAGHPPPDPAR
jgi:glutamate transport system permease protein